MQDSTATKLIAEWERSATSDSDARGLFVSARDEAPQALADLVVDGVDGLAVAPLALVLVADDASFR